MTNVLENPWLLLTLAAFSVIPAAIVCQAKPEWGYRPMLVPVLLAALGFGLDYAVQTDTEQIHTIIRRARQAVVTGQVRSMSNDICGRYDDGYHRSKEAFLASAERIVKGASVKKVRFQTIDLSVEENRIVAAMHTVVHLNQESRYAVMGSVVFVSLRLEFIPQPSGQWCLFRAGVTSVNNQPMNWGAVR